MNALTAPQVAALNVLTAAGYPVEDYDCRAHWDAMSELVDAGLVAEVAFSPDADGYELTNAGAEWAATAGIKAAPKAACERPRYCF